MRGIFFVDNDSARRLIVELICKEHEKEIFTSDFNGETLHLINGFDPEVAIFDWETIEATGKLLLEIISAVNCKRIVFLADKFTDDNRSILEKFFGLKSIDVWPRSISPESFINSLKKY